MSNRLAVLIAAALGAAPTFACGPDFSEVLLDSRAATLSDLPEGVFTREARELVPQPPGGFKAVDRADWIYTGQPPTRDAAEREMLDDAFERADAIRGQANAKAAYAAGEGLPEDARRYLAGAAAFDHDDPDEAARRFASVLDLPAGERTRYGVWAAYMLGRISTLDDGADKAVE